MNADKYQSGYVLKPFLKVGAVFFVCALAITAVNAENEVLDPSIFDGTGKEQETQEPEKEMPSNQTPPEEVPDETAGPSASAPEEEISPEEMPPEEIKLPESSSPESETREEGGGIEEEAENPLMENPPGVPAGTGSGESRAGQRTESTEKIPTGQAVDFPWDM